MKKKQTIADVAVELMKRNDEKSIGLHCYGFTDDIWEECVKEKLFSLHVSSVYVKKNGFSFFLLIQI